MILIIFFITGKMAIMKSIIRARGKGYLKVSIDICLDGDVPLSSSLIRVDDEVCLNPYEHLAV